MDPQGRAIGRALASLGHNNLADVRVGKAIQLVIAAPSGEAARKEAARMCRKLLANPVTEDYRIDAAARIPPKPESGEESG